jgi:hypothetical protein
MSGLDAFFLAVAVATVMAIGTTAVIIIIRTLAAALGDHALVVFTVTIAFGLLWGAIYILSNTDSTGGL